MNYEPVATECECVGFCLPVCLCNSSSRTHAKLCEVTYSDCVTNATPVARRTEKHCGTYLCERTCTHVQGIIVSMYILLFEHRIRIGKLGNERITNQLTRRLRRHCVPFVRLNVCRLFMPLAHSNNTARNVTHPCNDGQMAPYIALFVIYLPFD